MSSKLFSVLSVFAVICLSGAAAQAKSIEVPVAKIDYVDGNLVKAELYNSGRLVVTNNDGAYAVVNLTVAQQKSLMAKVTDLGTVAIEKTHNQVTCKIMMAFMNRTLSVLRKGSLKVVLTNLSCAMANKVAPADPAKLGEARELQEEMITIARQVKK